MCRCPAGRSVGCVDDEALGAVSTEGCSRGTLQQVSPFVSPELGHVVDKATPPWVMDGALSLVVSFRHRVRGPVAVGECECQA